MATTTAYYAINTWDQWATTGTTTTAINTWDQWDTTTTGIVWAKWSTATTPTTQTVGWQEAVEETEEQRRAREEQQRAWNRQQEENQRRQVEAQARAEKILFENLSDIQRADYKRHRHFFCEGRSGRRFRIRTGTVANVDVIDRDGRITHRICAAAGGHGAIPDADNMLAQMLHLTHDDEGFERMGNRHAAMDRQTQVAPVLQ